MLPETIFSSNKLLKHLDRVHLWANGGTPPPVTSELDLSGICNHHCPACSGGYHQGLMNIDTALDYIDQLADFGVLGLIFTGGGEPLLHPNWDLAIKHAAQRRFDVGFISIGVNLSTPEEAEELVRHCTWVRVSIDGDRGDYPLIHGTDPEDFDRAWAATGLLAQAKKRLKLETTVGVGFLLGASTEFGMVPAAVRARFAGVDYLQFRPFHGETFSVDPRKIDACRRVSGRTKILTSAVKYERMGQPRGYATCHGSYFTAVIQADGFMPLCCHLRGQPDFYLGDLKKNSFQEIWYRPRRDLFSRLDLDRCIPLCRNDGISCWLEEVIRPASHENFL